MAKSDDTARSWLELAVQVDHEAVESVAEVFAGIGFNEGVVIEEPFTQERDGDRVAVDTRRPVMVRTFVAAADVVDDAFPDVRRALGFIGQMRPVGPLEVTPRHEEDWANAWKDHFVPVRVGRRVVVRPPWRSWDRRGDDVVVELDPGMAFGTGTHPTTRLCMLALEGAVRDGDRVLDVGTGTGILAIAAALLADVRVDAVDIEPVSVRSARENVERNGLAGRVTIEQGSAGPDDPFPGPYDVVLANIIARVLIEIREGLVARVAPGGVLLLSGIIEDKEAAVRSAFDALGMRLEERTTEEDWISLRYRRPPAS
ncbi:MAG: Ribosomal protein L11 methyltransferase [uncultured Thermomicrobiales bacterium]|uniref:Ribosomal protein L11 methyltransferase n=1 Tax=uncultured Thermomicrobiales bacterium TaxID=1645740 RepID=A0A6J4U729_9BACT|nr:MAG: Ribosomal protein L11 methyltransferase [uncultured Thermomicrobiales bacterium]